MSKRRVRIKNNEIQKPPANGNGFKIIQVLLLIIGCFWVYGTYDEWSREREAEQLSLAKSLGFESVDEMREIKKLGFEDKLQYKDAEARKIGFENNEEKELRVSQGINNGTELAAARQRAEELGFDSIDEMIDLQDHGFNTKAEKIAKDKADEVARIAQEKANLLNSDYLSENYGVEANFECQPEVEKLAKFNYEWFDRWHESKFSSYVTKVYTPGVLIIVGDKIKFQNGFGSWQIMEYRCEYDTQNKKVLDVSAQPR
jgi:hypothetical protein